jgi:superfamily II DNA or RNA helicase
MSTSYVPGKVVTVTVDKVCRLSGLNREELATVIRQFRILDPNRMFDPQFRTGRWNGYYQYITGRGHFRVGLLSDVLAVIKRFGWQAQCRLQIGKDPEKKLRFHPKLQNRGFESPLGFARLRPDQMAALVKMRKKLLGVLAIPTAAGKSEIIFDYAKSHPDARILYLVKRCRLCIQSARRAEQYLNEPVGALTGTSRRNLDARFVCAVDKSLANAVGRKVFDKNSFDVVLVDECHGVTAETVKQIILYLNWKRLFGFTGSYPTKQRNLVKHWMVKNVIGPPIYQVSELEFNEKSDFIPEIKVLVVRNSVYIRPMSSFSQIYGDLKSDHTRNELIAKAALLGKKHVLVVVNHIDHGRAIERMIRRHTDNVLMISAKTSNSVCQQAFEDLDSGNLHILISSPIIDEGISINDIHTLVYAAGWKSEITLVQRLGRGKRTKRHGKNSLTVVDFTDNGHERCRKNAKTRFEVYKTATKHVQEVSFEALRQHFGGSNGN